MLYKFELGHKVTKVTKNICCAKGESVTDHSRVSKELKKHQWSGKVK